jgi:hypothetical protein
MTQVQRSNQNIGFPDLTYITSVALSVDDDEAKSDIPTSPLVRKATVRRTSHEKATRHPNPSHVCIQVTFRCLRSDQLVGYYLVLGRDLVHYFKHESLLLEHSHFRRVYLGKIHKLQLRNSMTWRQG